MTPPRWYRKPVIVAAIGLGLAIMLTVVLLGRRTSTGGENKEPTARIARSDSGSGMPGMKASSDGSVALTTQEMRQFGVTFGTVELRELSREIRTVGNVMVNESRLAKVTPRFNGYVEQLYVNFAGQQVTRGQPLAAIFSPEILAAEQELLVASRMSRTIAGSAVPGVPAGASDILAAAKQRLRLWNVSDGQISAVLRTGRPFRTVTLYAPSSGIVLEKKVVQGQAVIAGEELYTISDLSDVWVDAQIREPDAGSIAPGTAATLDFTGIPGRPYTGRVTFVYPTLGEQTRTVRARITVANPGRLLKPGMYATVRLKTSAQSALSVPRSAVMKTGTRSLVFVDMGAGRLMPHTVMLGRAGSDYIEILSGVQKGQRVVTSAQFLIDSESNLGDVMKGMGDMAEPDPGLSSKGAAMRNMPGMSSPAKR